MCPLLSTKIFLSPFFTWDFRIKMKKELKVLHKKSRKWKHGYNTYNAWILAKCILEFLTILFTSFIVQGTKTKGEKRNNKSISTCFQLIEVLKNVSIFLGLTVSLALAPSGFMPPPLQSNTQTGFFFIFDILVMNSSSWKQNFPRI